MAPIRQTSFLAGELAPTMWGRTDAPEFARGARTLKNFFVTRQGMAMSRPGFQHCAVNPLTSARVRFVPFVYSDEDAYVLVFTIEAIYFLLDGELVMDGMSPLLVATLYQEVDLPELQFIQSGDVIIITHRLYPPRQLSRISALVWTIEDIDFGRLPPYNKDPDTSTVTLDFAIAHRWLPSTIYILGDTVTQGDAHYECVTAGTSAASGGPGLSGTPFGSAIVDGSVFWCWRGDIEHPAREWRYKVTVLVQHVATGQTFETLPYEVTGTCVLNASSATGGGIVPHFLILGKDRHITLQRITPVGLIGTPAGWEDYRSIAFVIYRGRGELFGFIGQTKTRDFVDVGDEPNYALQPPIGTNPFEVYDTDEVLVRTEHPSTVAYFQERRVFGGTTERPSTLFFSAVGDYSNFDRRTLAPPGSALEFELFTRRKEDVCTVLDLGRLLIFTTSTVRSMAGQQGEPLDKDSVDARLVEEIGSKRVAPVVVDGCALFIRSKGQGVRALVPSQNASGFMGVDISVQSEHLFVGTNALQPWSLDVATHPYSIVDWCYQEDPWGIVWAVRNDGVLLSLTFSRQTESWGWTQHEVDGQVLAVCAIPEGEEDAVYLAVLRYVADVGGVVLFERMTSRVQRGGLEDDMCVDYSVRYEGATKTNFDGLEHLVGEEVYLLCKGSDPLGPFTVDEDGEINLDEEPPETDNLLTAYIGKAFTCDFETLDLASSNVRMKPKRVKRIGVEVSSSRGLKAGTSFDSLEEWQQRTVEMGFEPLTNSTEVVELDVSSGFDRGGRACIRQDKPLPLTIVGVTRDVDLGD